MTFAISNFSMPYYLADGGFTGLKVIVYRLFGMNPGVAGYLINVPLLVIFYRLYDRRTLLATLYGMAVFNGLLWFFVELGPVVPGHLPRLLVALLYGLQYGLGIGIVASVRGTTGGSFIIAMLAERYTRLSISKAVLIFDALVILLAMTVFLTWLNALYTLLAMVVASGTITATRRAAIRMRNKPLLSLAEKSERSSPPKAVVFPLLGGGGAKTFSDRDGL